MPPLSKIEMSYVFNQPSYTKRVDMLDVGGNNGKCSVVSQLIEITAKNGGCIYPRHDYAAKP